MPVGESSDDVAVSDCVILCDGSLPGLVALAIEAERAESAPFVIAGDPNGGVDAGSAGAARDAVCAQAEIYNAQMIDGSYLLGGCASHDQSPALLAAARIAATVGRRRLVWGVQYPYLGTEPDLDAIATTVDRTLLISRLASLDLWDDSEATVPEILIETPLVDLSDEQVADLASDMSVPWQTVWWLGAQSEHARQVRSRWEGVCEHFGLVVPANAA
jgi:hypothetical protein